MFAFTLNLKAMKARQSKYAKKLFENESQARKILKKIRQASSERNYVSTNVTLNNNKKVRVKEL